MSTMYGDQTPPAEPVQWHAAPPVTPTEQAPTDQPAAPAAAAPKANRGKVAAGVAALLIAVGGTTGYLVSHASSGGTTTAAAAQGGTAGTAGGPGAAGGAGGMGFQPTAYHLDGTITAIGNGTVTIKLTSGTTTTYTVTSSTHLMNNGSAVALSSFKVGDSVRGSTTTQGGTTLNDMVSGTFGGGARNGTPPQGTAPQGTTGTGTGTGTTT